MFISPNLKSIPEFNQAITDFVKEESRHIEQYIEDTRKHLPFKEKDSVDHPLQLYAVSKRSNELMAHSYSSLYNLPTTGLRIFR